jgi:hypothetical protein
VQIGIEGRMRDGVLGFFLGTGAGDYDFSRFYSPCATGSGSDIVPPRITLAADGSPVRLLLLVDPHARIHAISGMLPTASLAIPPELTLPFLDTLSVTFAARPVLAANEGFTLPLPAEPGYSWNWIQHDGTAWTTRPLAPAPSPAAARYAPQRIYSGWLQLKRLEDGS